MIVLQTIAQLREHYGKDGAAIFLANCRMQLSCLRPTKRPRDISARRSATSPQVPDEVLEGRRDPTSYQEREDGARLIRPEQVRMLGDDTILALVQNSYPILANKVIYYEDRVLKPIFESQTGPLPEPPALSEDPVSDALEPMMPMPSEDRADNPFAVRRPAPNLPDPAPIAGQDVANGHGDDGETAGVERDISRAERFRDKSRLPCVRSKPRD